MADYDGVVRIGTKIDTSGFKDGEKELESESEKLADKLSDSSDIELKIDTSGAEKELEKVFDSIEKQEKRIKKAAEKATEVSVPQISGEERPYTPGYDQSVIEYIENLEKQSEELKKADEHFNLLKIDVEEYSKSLKELQAHGKFFGDEEYDKVYLAWKNATDAVKEYRAELNKKSALGQAKEAELQEAAQRRAEEQAEKALQKENERIQKQIENEAKLQAKEAERQAILQAQEAEEQRLDQIRVNAVAVNDQIIEKVERIKELEQEIADLKKAGVTEGYSDYDERIQELEKLKKEITEYKKSLSDVPKKFEDMQKSAKKAFNAISEETKKSSGLLSTFASRLKGLLLSLLIFNWISKAFRTMISGMKKGFENFIGYSDSYAQSVQNMKNSMSTLGNQFAAAFAPIVQMVIPWLMQLINTIAKAMTYVAQFIALLTGASTFTRAKQIQDKYSQSLNGTAKAADKARGALAKFDDLDVLEKKEDASGAGGAEATLSKDMFEEVPVDPKIVGWMENLGAIIDIVKEKAVGLKDVFAQGFFDSLGDWKSKWENIKASAKTIKDALLSIFTDSAVRASENKFYESFAYMLGSLVGYAASIGSTIATNLIGGISLYLEQNKDRIKDYLVNMFEISAELNNIIAQFYESIAFIFEAFGSENAQQLTANVIGIFTNAFMGVTEIAGNLAVDIIDIITRPFIENKEGFRTALDGFLGVLSEVTGTIKNGIGHTFDKLNEVYDAHFKPFFESIANGLSDTTGKFLEFWNSYMQPILNGMAKKFDTVWTEHIQPAIDKSIELMGKVVDALKLLWETILKPIIDWIIENVLPVIASISEGITNACLEGIAAVADIASGIMEYFEGIIDFLIGVFTDDWETAWNGITKIVSGVKDTIKGIINAILGFLEAMANSFISEINGIINALESLASIKNPITGEVVWSLDLPEIPSVSIPRLATGAVIRGGNPFMAILGDQPAGKTNIEAPAGLIKDMVAQGIAEAGIGSRENIPVNINIIYDGETTARVMIPDILSELSRQGYNVDLLGYT